MSIDLPTRLHSWRQTTSTRRAANTAANLNRPPAFPGRWIGGLSLIIGPILILTGTLLRSQFYFFVPYQLRAYHQHPTLITAAYACFALGFVLLWPAIMTLAQRIYATHPLWAMWGGCLVMIGLFTRTFQYGTDHFAFHLTDSLGLPTMLTGISDYYDAWRETTWHPFKTMSGPAFFGWVVLAIGAYRSGALGLGRSIALGLMSVLALGPLKGTEPQSFLAVGGLCLAFIPLGISLLRNGPAPTKRAMIWFVVLIAIHILMTGFGPRG
ncbi:hypothetical protein [Planobispora takensis]|nr:hypothetical protein [Planobispora takensis]